MPTLTAVYKGDLRTEATHVLSGNTVFTDAPLDNNGKGEAFSPTDLLCASLNSCMMTLMGILARREGIRLEGLTSEVIKIMDQNPRKVKEIQIVFTHPHLVATDVQKEKLIRAAMTCPVGLSLSDSLKQTIEFKF
jgi:putative redox protein